MKVRGRTVGGFMVGGVKAEPMPFVTVKLPFAPVVNEKARNQRPAHDRATRDSGIARVTEPLPTSRMNRRRFFTVAGTAAALPLARVEAAPATELIDTNVWLGHWPTRRGWAESPGALVARLRRHGVTSAWAGHCDSALHTDLAGDNARLADLCAKEGGGVLVPFGTVNPAFPDWEEDVRRCREVHRMPGVRLLPSYHGYTLDDPRFVQLLDRATEHGLIVQIVVTVEDERSQNPALQAAAVNTAPLADLLEKRPRARVMLLNATSRILGTSTALLQRLTRVGAAFEIATLESVAGIEAVLSRVPTARLAFGSHSPYYYFEAALLKLQESDLSPTQLAAVRHGHARALLSPA